MPASHVQNDGIPDIYEMRSSDGDITCQSLCHCCIHSRMKTAVEVGKTAWPSRGQGPDKAMIKKGAHNDKQDWRQTWTKDKRRTRGLPPWHEDSRRFANVATRSRRRTLGGPEKDTGFASAARGDKRQEEDKRRTREGQEEDQHGQRTRAGQEEDKTRTQSSGARPASVASSLFPKREPQ